MTKKKGLVIIAVLMTLVMAVLVGFVVSKKEYRIEIIGEEVITVEVFGTYTDPGAILFENDKEFEGIEIDDSLVNLDVLGDYLVFYKYLDHEKITLSRTIKVVDTVVPEIKLEKDTLELTEGDEFKDPGFSASDNYDGDITDKVVVSGDVDTKLIGEYQLHYAVEDSSGNMAEMDRKVIVKEKYIPPVVVVPKPGTGGSNVVSGGGQGNKGNYTGTCSVGDGSTVQKVPVDNPLSTAKTPSNSKNEVICFRFIGQGISIRGIHDQNITTLGLLSSNGTIAKSFEQQQNGQLYHSNMDLKDVANGSYTLVSTNLDNMKLVNQFNVDRRIVQAQVGSKLVKVSYPNNNIQIDISNYAKQYDIAINVGHGGSDGGSQGNGQSESALNLMVSLYEKQRFEAHGYKVYINRTNNNTYGDEAGPSNWPRFRRSAYKMGEVASVSRFAYSNHHNSTGGNKSKSGWEILVNARATASDLAIEQRVGNAWTGIYGKPMTGSTIYTKHYYATTIFSKSAGQVYNFIDWYGMQRVTDMLFNEFVPTYEHIYLSNAQDVSWYMNGKWKDMAEAKVKEYVTALGGTYRAPQ